MVLAPVLFVIVVVRALMKRRIAQAEALARAGAQAELATLAERLRGRDEQLAVVRADLDGARGRAEASVAEAGELRARLAEAETRLDEVRASGEEKLALLAEAKEKLGEAFAGAAGSALEANAESFLRLAHQRFETLQAEAQGELEQRRQAIEGVVAPLKEQLGRYEVGLRELERARQEAYGGLAEQVRGLAGSQQKLQLETGNLVKALRAPQVRGRWGEMQLKRAVEFAGMVDRVDFVEQQAGDTEDGRQRPDLIVMLPGGRSIVVDAKAPLDAYLAAVEAQDGDERNGKLADHARQVRDHVRKLAAKSYWEQFENAPDFVVLFLPGETFFSAALEHDPELIEEAFRHSVVLATPTTLVALLKSVAYGWRQEDLARNAARIGEEARALYDRVRVFAEHLDRVGKGLESAVRAHNEAAGSFTARVVPQGRRLEELALAPERRLEPPREVETAPRQLGPAEPDVPGSN
jgi:DNA recombination protein RmuC